MTCKIFLVIPLLIINNNKTTLYKCQTPSKRRTDGQTVRPSLKWSLILRRSNMARVTTRAHARSLDAVYLCIFYFMQQRPVQQINRQKNKHAERQTDRKQKWRQRKIFNYTILFYYQSFSLKRKSSSVVDCYSIKTWQCSALTSFALMASVEAFIRRCRRSTVAENCRTSMISSMAFTIIILIVYS